MFTNQRIRDPLHNLIQFSANEFENAMWRVIQSRPFQRLRRIKQLGFSELVYPGATHTRFAHCVGAFHTARLLMQVIEKHLGQSSFSSTKANTALAASLVHDLGHGPFSHAFEDVGKRLNLKSVHHEKVSERLIRDSTICEALNSMGSGFASDVAEIIKSAGPRTLYDAVVSSQFDADRLDYMRRDRLMTGTHHGAIDFDWLLSNLEIGQVSYGVDEEAVGTIETFVLGPKASFAAETYLLSLFQLYPTVYFHKATRGAEKVFSELLYRVVTLVQSDSLAKTGLPQNHPLAVFARDPENLESVLNLDDTVIWGATSMMADAEDPVISDFSRRIRDRRLFKCFDITEMLKSQTPSLDGTPSRPQLESIKAISEKIAEWRKAKEQNGPRILIDEVVRKPYNRLDESKGKLNQILIKTGPHELVDVAQLSSVVRGIQPFRVFRAYAAREDSEAKTFLKTVIDAERICQ